MKPNADILPCFQHAPAFYITQSKQQSPPPFAPFDKPKTTDSQHQSSLITQQISTKVNSFTLNIYYPTHFLNSEIQDDLGLQLWIRVSHEFAGKYGLGELIRMGKRTRGKGETEQAKEGSREHRLKPIQYMGIQKQRSKIHSYELAIII